MARVGAPLTPKRRARFLAELTRRGVVKYAAEAAGFSRRTAYKLRADDPEFAAAWDEALDDAADDLEAEAVRRAREGVEEPLTCARGLIEDTDGQPVVVRKYSDTLLIFLLKGARPEKYRDNVKVSGSLAHSLVPTGNAKTFGDELVAAMQAHPEAQDDILATLRRLGETTP